MSYTISNVTEADVDGVMKFMKRTFYIDEPLYKGVGYCNSESDQTPDLDDFCKQSLPGESLVAKSEDGDIIGALICDVSPLVNPMDYLNALKNCKCPKYKKVIQMMILREVLMEIWDKYPNENVLFEVKMASTDPKWRNKGIMNRLMDEAEKSARQLDINLMRIETSSAYSAKSSESRGYKCIFSRPYSAFELDGRPLIVPDPPHLYDRVYVKELY